MSIFQIGVTSGTFDVFGQLENHLHVHIDVETPTRLDPQQEQLLRDLARVRGEEHADISVTTAANGGGLFSRLRDAFK